MTNTGWLFVLTASAFVVFVIWLAVSRFGNIPLGRDDEGPEFRTVSWVAMMFSAGMGIGLMFYGVSEPITHFATPPPGTGGAGNPEAAQTAMATTLFHWTLHPWAIYAVVGLAIAYGVYRKGRHQYSSAFESLLGERANGPAGRVIDILAIFATLFGSATSLGLGALQIQRGLEIVGGVGQVGNAVLIGIIAVLTAAFVLSAVTGVAKGIQWLSNINMVLAIGLALFVFVVGPTVFILNLVRRGSAAVQELAMMSARTGAEGSRPTPGSSRGRSSTGPGGSRGRRSWACSSPASPVVGPSASSWPAYCWCRAWSASCGSASSVARRSTCRRRAPTSPVEPAAWSCSCSARSRPTRSPPPRASW